MQMDKIIETILPYTPADKKCLQKKMIKERNRHVLQRVLIMLQADPYLHFKAIFEPTHLSNRNESERTEPTLA